MERLRQFASTFFSKEIPQEVAGDEAPTAAEPAEEPLQDIDLLETEEELPEQVIRLLAPGRVEELVREGRTPLVIADVSDFQNGKKLPMYQTPPPGFKPDKIDHIYMSTAGAFSFVSKDGSQKVGPTYVLTEEQAQALETRVAAEKERIRQAQQ